VKSLAPPYDAAAAECRDALPQPSRLGAGVFSPAESTKLEFHPLGSLSNRELADLMQAVRIRVLGYLARQGVIESSADLTIVDNEFAEHEPALAALARASVAGSLPRDPSGGPGRPSSCTANRVCGSNPVSTSPSSAFRCTPRR
jgi:hypothetical protein